MVGNGYADVKKIEGNTIVWNQMVQNGNFNGNIDRWSAYDSSNVSVAYGNKSIIATLNSSGQGYPFGVRQTISSPVVNHKYFVKYKVKPSVDTTFGCEYANINISIVTCPANVFTTVKGIIIPVSPDNPPFIIKPTSELNTGDTYEIKDVIFIDVTKMFGAGNEPITVEEFEHLFPIEYAPYCEGRLVSLGGYGIKWNQMVQNGNFASKYWWVVTGDYTVSNNVATVTSDTTISLLRTPDIITPNHKYYVSAVVNQNLTNNPDIRIAFQTSTGTGLTNHYYSTTPSTNTKITDIILSENTAARMSFGYYNTFTPNESYQISNIQLFDLTEMFGPGSEPTLEEFEAMFGTEYCPYDEGTEMNVLEKMGVQDDLSVKSAGFNLWDEEWESGDFDNNGQPHLNPNWIRSINFCPILPNTQYFRKTSGQTVYFLQYDSNKNYIGVTSAVSFTTRPNTTFFKLQINGTSYNHDICINLSDPSRNGTYEPYKETTLDLSWIKSIKDNEENQLFPNGLLSAGNIYDEVGEDYAIKRVGIVDLGMLTWSYQDYGSGDIKNYFRARLDNAKKIINAISCICTKYQSVPNQSYGSTIGLAYGDKKIAFTSDSSGLLIITDSSYTDTTTFKSAISGVILYYELETPITITFPSPKDLGYNVQSGGTEQLLPTNPAGTGPITAPIIESVNYPLDAVGTLTNLPQNYISVESMDSFTTALGNTLNLNITKTWDSSDNKWTFSVTSRS